MTTQKQGLGITIPSNGPILRQCSNFIPLEKFREPNV